MDPLEYLRVAELWAQGASEPEWRSAVSRAYYAAFHVARYLLEACRFRVPRGERAHAYLWLRLANAGHADVQFAGNGLRSLRTDRNWADYDFAHPMSRPQASMNAKKIIQHLTAAGSDPTKTLITDAMKVYERDVLMDVTWHP
jgi:uncharacterized protein (UPF0332 family)